jgi:predicted TIM-barrel enzyme
MDEVALYRHEILLMQAFGISAPPMAGNAAVNGGTQPSGRLRRILCSGADVWHIPPAKALAIAHEPDALAGGSMAAIARAEIMKKFRDMVARGIPIVGGGAGTGISAVAEEAGGIDLIIIYNSGRYRMAGRGSAAGLLAYGNANAIVQEMALEVLPVVKRTPVLAGVNATDPFILLPRLLAELKALGFSGVQNFPTVGLFDGVMRQSFEETGMGFGLEVEMIAEAHRQDLLTTPYVFNPVEAVAMTAAGADIVVAHMGVTTGGAIGAKTGKSLAQCAEAVAEIAAAARAARPDVIVLCHGGPIAMPDDARFILERVPDCHGFYGASSMERLPVELAIKSQVERFKELTLRARGNVSTAGPGGVSG